MTVPDQGRGETLVFKNLKSSFITLSWKFDCWTVLVTERPEKLWDWPEFKQGHRKNHTTEGIGRNRGRKNKVTLWSSPCGTWSHYNSYEYSQYANCKGLLSNPSMCWIESSLYSKWVRQYYCSLTECRKWDLFPNDPAPRHISWKSELSPLYKHEQRQGTSPWSWRYSDTTDAKYCKIPIRRKICLLWTSL